jgi:phosphoribosylformylglycinamidine synthase
LLPGALLHNDHQKFNCKNVWIKPQTLQTHLTSQLDLNTAYKIPIAHGEGRYYCNEETLSSLKQNDQILFKYCTENASVDANSNPNGSLENIAGICNQTRNVFGMMPHPERAVDAELFNTDGRLLFEGLLTALLK